MSEAFQAAITGSFGPAVIADRYPVHEILGRGGMACVYRVTDALSGRETALKQLVLGGPPEFHDEITALFQREFHTLAQLRHPRVIEVYDYGVSPGVGPYYTMELLDGGDLRERAPLPWRDACSLLFDVCSSLALLHSRRLLHRDVSPRNIRCTRTGTAKLIDFGAMAPMGRNGGRVVGTPPFMPPETLQRSTLDGRADLFAVGATLYYALTRSLAYPARSFADLLDVWKVRPSPPSSRAPGVPAALDDLVMSLLSLEPSLRPPSAFEVMQRLAAIGGFECDETSDVSRGYLSTPVLAGREEGLRELRDLLAQAVGGKGGGLLIHAASGLGCSRMLDACALEAKTMGATVLRAAATGGPDADSSVMRGLLHHAQQALSSEAPSDRFPELFGPLGGRAAADGDDEARTQMQLRQWNDPAGDADALRQELGRFMIALSARHPLVIVVDDVHRIDAASAAFLVSLIDLAASAHVFVALTAEGDAASMPASLQLLAGRCRKLGLSPLTGAQSQALLGSIFGDVPNLHSLAEEIAALARGNPREIIVIAQHLVDNQSIRYAGGRWTLPSQLSVTDLPGSAEDAIRTRIAGLSPRARMLAEAHALAFHPALTRDDYLALSKGASPAEVDAAISELLSKNALTVDRLTYTLANRIWTAALTGQLGAVENAARHAALCVMYEGKSAEATVHHLFAAGLEERGLQAMLERVSGLAQHFDFRAALKANVPKLAPIYLRALEVAERLGRSPRELHELRRWLVSLSVVTDARYYWSAAPAWLEQLKHDSGFDLFQADRQPGAPLERLMRALTQANERYLATPEAERVYRADEAIRSLAHYVAISAAVGSRSMDSSLPMALPDLLEPFAPLLPVIDALWQNATAAREASCHGRYERARARWSEVHSRLDQITGAELQHVEVIRNAVAFALGLCEAMLGLPSAVEWADRLDRDPMHRVNAVYLRKIVRFEQGDFELADRLRKQAEVLALQAGSPQMFTTLLVLELNTHALAHDLAGVKEVLGRIEPLAAEHPGWVPYRHLAEGRFQLIRGDHEAARLQFERCIALTAPDAEGRSSVLSAWISANTGHVESLLARGRNADARRVANRVLARCDELGIEVQTYELIGLCALAEARLGAHTAAAALLDPLIERQTELGVSGLRLGLSYEMRARVALCAGDMDGFQRYADLTAREYRHATGGPLAARYERLMNEVRRTGDSLPQLADFEPSTVIQHTRQR